MLKISTNIPNCYQATLLFIRACETIKKTCLILWRDRRALIWLSWLRQRRKFRCLKQKRDNETMLVASMWCARFCLDTNLCHFHIEFCWVSFNKKKDFLKIAKHIEMRKQKPKWNDGSPPANWSCGKSKFLAASQENNFHRNSFFLTSKQVERKKKWKDFDRRRASSKLDWAGCKD